MPGVCNRVNWGNGGNGVATSDCPMRTIRSVNAKKGFIKVVRTFIFEYELSEPKPILPGNSSKKSHRIAREPVKYLNSRETITLLTAK